jgi:hypothetical protein
MNEILSVEWRNDSFTHCNKKFDQYLHCPFWRELAVFQIHTHIDVMLQSREVKTTSLGHDNEYRCYASIKRN